MTISVQRLLQDISPFVDLGTDPAKFVEQDSNIIGRFYRDGGDRTLTIAQNGSVVETVGEQQQRYSSVRSLLAGPAYANLGKWADSQTSLLRGKIEDDTIPIQGRLSGSLELGGIPLVDDALGDGSPNSARNTVVLVDGPAGIGKTSLIRGLAHQRAKLYRSTQRPLILHVESRGRVLQNITDLMAFGLQTLRVPVTYDQVPSLVRNGLICLAIDGFDELGDPNGYELAWAQLNELIVDCRGNGSLLLSGRETFLNKERVERTLVAIDREHDDLLTYSLSLTTPSAARSWLSASGWSDELLSSEQAAPLLADNSYALRPFFLRQIALPEIASRIEHGKLDDLLSFLIDAMLDRESLKFGRDVDAVTKPEDLVSFIRVLMEEVARDLAENQSDAISADTLLWLSEAVGAEFLPPEVIGIAKNRAGVVAFLAEDDRRGYKTFIHEQVQNYFLAHVTVSSVVSGEMPKFIRRNIFGAEFLENFAQVVRHMPSDLIDKFVETSVISISQSSSHDRTRANLAALILAIYSVSGIDQTCSIRDVQIDEAYLSETVSAIELNNVVIAQLDARGTDFRNVSFVNCTIVSMLADEGTMPPPSLPVPAFLSLPDNAFSKPEEIKIGWSSN